MVRLHLSLLPAFLMFLAPHVGFAQTAGYPTTTKVHPIDSGAGYKMVIAKFGGPPFASAVPVHSGPKGPEILSPNLEYPLIISPLTPGAKAYNVMIERMALRWWADIGAPADISSYTTPGMGFQLNCTPGGAVLNNDGSLSGEQPMLPGVISLMCFAYQCNGNQWVKSSESGYNWIMAQRRTIRASDVFRKNSGWLKALTTLTNTQRANTHPEIFLPPGAPIPKLLIFPLDLANTRHWLLTRAGLGLVFNEIDFVGAGPGYQPSVAAIIPWSKLRPYLNPHGIVPQNDWNTAPPSTN